MKKQRKGMGMSILVTIIVLVAVLLMVLSFTGRFGGLLRGKGDIEVCRLSALAQAESKKFDILKTGNSPISLKCVRRQVKFFNNKIEINGKKEEKFKFKELDDEIVNKIVAEELRTCWYMMGEGEIDVFRTGLIMEDLVCTICSEISFDKDIKKKEFTGLVNFLKVEKIPESDEYYLDYLIESQQNKYAGGALGFYIPWSNFGPWSYGTTNLIDGKRGTGMPSETSFDTSQEYIVYFLGFKPGSYNELLRAYESAYYIGLGSPGKVAEECRRLVN